MLSYRLISTADLIPYARNSRTHSEAQVAKIASSIREFGFINPVVTDGKNGIVAGHGRVLAAHKLGLKDVPCVEASHLTEAQKRAYVIADNRMALDAGWDNDMLKVELEELKGLDFDLALTGFDIGELDSLLADKTAGLTDPDEVPEVPVNPVSVSGDIWVMGKHRLMCGDSTSIDAIDRLCEGRKAQAVITDPPYNQETEGGFRGEIGKSLKKQSADIEHLCNFDVKPFLQILPAVHEKGKMNATVFCNKDLVPDYLSWARDSGYSFNILVWKKPSVIPLGGSYMPDIEYCLVFRKSGVFNTKIDGVSYSKVLVHKRETGLHPTMKPVALLENQIRIVSDNGGIVVDLFGGSGSTLIACEKTGRQGRVMELDPRYVDVAIKRWQDFTGQKAILESTGRTFEDMASDRYSPEADGSGSYTDAIAAKRAELEAAR